MRRYIALIVVLVLGAAAYATETITYTYDVHGRLVKVVHTGTVNNNLVSNYTYDPADNRNTVTTTGASH